MVNYKIGDQVAAAILYVAAAILYMLRRLYCVPTDNNATSWPYLASRDLPDFQLG
jgi:hypothetical protein